MALRRFLICLLLLVRLHPVLAFVPVAVQAQADELTHACVHQLQPEHSHTAEGALTLEPSAPAPHVHHDAGHHVAVLMEPTPVIVARLGHAPPPLAVAQGAPTPYLEGPLRPPRLI